MGCYGCLVDGDATEKPLPQLVREETASAVTDAGIATTVVVVMLLAAGVGPALVVGAAVAAAVGTYVFHQVVLVVGVAIARWRAKRLAPQRDPA
jgi:hypothetical protein